MKHYSDYTEQYVQDICDALNEAGVYMDKNTQKPFAPEHFDSLTNFLHKYVVMPLSLYTFLNDKGLVNRGRCPYTGQRIDTSFPKWTYMNSRSIYVSHDGYKIMRKEDDEEYEKIMGHPAPPRKTGGCYIATVCYGNEYAPEVIILKSYRDEVLSKSIAGRAFIKIYYLFSPTIARALQNNDRINNFLRKTILDKIVNKINRQ